MRLVSDHGVSVDTKVGESVPLESAQEDSADPSKISRPDRSSTALTGRTILLATDISMGFGAKTVLSEVNLNVRTGSITALIGPTGCGKTTLLRSFNRMNDKVKGYWRNGSVEFDGVDVAHHADPRLLRRRVGMVFQRPNPFPMSIKNNVLVGVKAHGMTPDHEHADVAEQHLKTVGLWAAVSDRMGDSPFRLSGGQQQLLCLARALAVEPDVLLLDEPTSSLDPGIAEHIENLLRELAPHITIVIVTHNLGQARRLSHMTAFLYSGRLIEVGDTQQICESPAEPETVSYVSGRIG